MVLPARRAANLGTTQPAYGKSRRNGDGCAAGLAGCSPMSWRFSDGAPFVLSVGPYPVSAGSGTIGCDRRRQRDITAIDTFFPKAPMLCGALDVEAEYRTVRLG
jgi:hypothetical protein